MEDILDFEESPKDVYGQYSKQLKKAKIANRIIYFLLIFSPLIAFIFTGETKALNMPFSGRTIGIVIGIWVISGALGILAAIFPYRKYTFYFRWVICTHIIAATIGATSLFGMIYLITTIVF